MKDQFRDVAMPLSFEEHLAIMPEDAVREFVAWGQWTHGDTRVCTSVSHFLSKILRHGTCRNPNMRPQTAWGVVSERPRAHKGHKYNPKHWAYMDTGGWVEADEATEVVRREFGRVWEKDMPPGWSRAQKRETGSEWAWNYILASCCTGSHVTGDKKLRFLLACSTTELCKTSAEIGRDHVIKDVVAIRAIQGHAVDFVQADRSGVTLTAEDAVKLPYLVHGTEVANIPSILGTGLIPGGIGDATHGEGRNSIHLALWPINDKRCMGGMRKSGSVNALIYLNKVALVQEKRVTVTPGLCALVNEPIEPGFIHCVT